MADFFSQIWASVVTFLGSYNLISDTLDILLVAFVIYYLIKLVRDSRAEQLLKGIALLVGAFFLAWLLNLTTLYYLLKTVFDNSLIVLIVIFQPEIRRALEQAGHSRFRSFNLFNLGGTTEEESHQQWQKAIEATCAATAILQKQRMGALIVFERKTKLGEIVRSGTVINAEPTTELIGNVFFNKAPLHDGAMIIRDGRVYAAGCILPLTDNTRISSELGTRHRAGVGMSENSDALVVIVSEETGVISMAANGMLKRNFSQDALHIALENGLLIDQDSDDKENGGRTKPRLFRRGKTK